VRGGEQRWGRLGTIERGYCLEEGHLWLGERGGSTEIERGKREEEPGQVGRRGVAAGAKREGGEGVAAGGARNDSWDRWRDWEKEGAEERRRRRQEEKGRSKDGKRRRGATSGTEEQSSRDERERERKDTGKDKRDRKEERHRGESRETLGRE
jgi:hypothetical protein